ncbi:MAG: chemotaxis protein CheA, partial [Planctomycetota bacterium]
MPERDQYFQIFLEESADHLQDLESNLLALEHADEETQPALINEAFRAIHSIKGAAGFYDLEPMNTLSHSMETVLMRVRDGKSMLSAEAVGTALEGADLLRAMLETPSDMDSVDFRGCEDRLLALLKEASYSPASAVPPEASGLDKCLQIFGETVTNAIVERIDSGLYAYLLTLDPPKALQAFDNSPASFLESIGALCTVVASSPPPEDSDGILDAGEWHVAIYSVLEKDQLPTLLGIEEQWITTVSPENEHSAPPIPQTPIASQPSSLSEVGANSKPAPLQESGETDGSVRVRLKTLNTLVNLTGELVLTRNQLLRGVDLKSEQVIEDACIKVNRITSELQEQVMSTRMQSIGIVFQKFKRVIRDLSQNLGKEVVLHIEGEDVELDRNIVEAIGDPLTHLVRNAIDHGIEPPEVRQAAGKPRQGMVRLKASHEAGMIIIEIQEDGAGIDVEKIKRKAVANHLYSLEQLNTMSALDIQRLIFHPGFSTADTVTELSGRGVGMDVVQTNINRLGGSID